MVSTPGRRFSSSMPRRCRVASATFRNAVMLMIMLCGCALVGGGLFSSFQEGWLIVCLPALIFVPTVGAFAILDREKERAATRLQLAHDEVERIAAISERERIARDMHDVLGHTLTMIALKADLAKKVVGKDRALLSH